MPYSIVEDANDEDAYWIFNMIWIPSPKNLHVDQERENKKPVESLEYKMVKDAH